MRLIAVWVAVVSAVGMCCRGDDGAFARGQPSAGWIVFDELSTPKSGKPRAVPMAREVASAIAKLLAGRGDPDADELVFPGAGGGYLDGSALRRRYRAAQKRAGLRALRFHDLRHTFASLAVNRVDIVKLQAWMGHADVKTTMRYLRHKSHADDAELLDGAFEPTTAAGVLQAANLAAVPVSA